MDGGEGVNISEAWTGDVASTMIDSTSAGMACTSRFSNRFCPVIYMQMHALN